MGKYGDNRHAIKGRIYKKEIGMREGEREKVDLIEFPNPISPRGIGEWAEKTARKIFSKPQHLPDVEVVVKTVKCNTDIKAVFTTTSSPFELWAKLPTKERKYFWLATPAILFPHKERGGEWIHSILSKLNSKFLYGRDLPSKNFFTNLIRKEIMSDLIRSLLLIKSITAPSQEEAKRLWKACSKVFDSLPPLGGFQEAIDPQWDEPEEEDALSYRAEREIQKKGENVTVVFTTVTSERRFILHFVKEKLVKAEMHFTSKEKKGSSVAAEQVISKITPSTNIIVDGKIKEGGKIKASPEPFWVMH